MRPMREPERALEWGQATDEPGSRVRDVDGAAVFTGSHVQAVAAPLLRGTVVELVDVEHVRVDWDGVRWGGGEPVLAAVVKVVPS